MKKLIFISVSVVLMGFLTLPGAVWADFFAGVELNNNWDDDNDYEFNITSKMGYENAFYAHVAWTKPVEPSSDPDGEMEFEHEHDLWGGFALKNEVYYDLDAEDWAAEATPKWYIKLESGVKLGFEVEFDYLKNDEFDLYEIEIEPTIKGKIKELGPGDLKWELEAPVCRLYTSSEDKDDFEVETIQPILNYGVPVFEKKAVLEFEFEFPYDVQDEELDKVFTFYFTYYF